MVSIFSSFLLLLFILFKCEWELSVYDFGILRNDKLLLKEFCFLKLINKPRYFVLFLPTTNWNNKFRKQNDISIVSVYVNRYKEKNLKPSTSDAVLFQLDLWFLQNYFLCLRSHRETVRYTSPKMEDIWLLINDWKWRFWLRHAPLYSRASKLCNWILKCCCRRAIEKKLNRLE